MLPCVFLLCCLLSLIVWQVSVLKLAPVGTRGPLACLFGVFDGHGGDGASKFVANHLHHLVREHNMDLNFSLEATCVQDVKQTHVHQEYTV